MKGQSSTILLGIVTALILVVKSSFPIPAPQGFLLTQYSAHI